jgi:hypothetical protein
MFYSEDRENKRQYDGQIKNAKDRRGEARR